MPGLHAFFLGTAWKVIAARRILLIVVVGLGMAFPASADERLDLLKSISAAGAPGLTLKMLDQAQPRVDDDL